MNGFDIAVTLKGKSMADIVAQAQMLIDADANTAVTTATTGKRGKKAKTEAVEEETELLADTETSEDEGQLGFDMDEEEEEPTPSAKKLTDKDVNTAAMAHAKKHGRKETMGILTKKFKVKSILELKADQYPAVIKALKV